ncbi:DUF3613 domain-containing protein [Burkholderia catarinensis]|uniref:DUF3613 domain-containing protein n=1 Tax=Burkholderia catarinensis TaxID=1108140 RepID=UPI0009113433|nr:DUF3613 domain-containing protein [Burkholderia catarinensis]KAG8149616.1 hypothetical protein BFF94_031355 [Burkholderia catarinensis]
MTNNKNPGRAARMRQGVALFALMGAATAAYCEQPAPDASEIGHATNALLAFQRDDRAAGPALPMLGDAASLTYQRYLESFKHKIPESMGSPVNANGSGSSGGQSSSQSY